MTTEMKNDILNLLDGKVEAIGFAPVERFKDAPEQHHPSRICKDARTVIVLGKAIPRSILHSPDYSLHLLHRACHTAYEYLNQLSLMLSTWFEAKGSYFSVQIPSVVPVVTRNNESWGLLSLKQAAVKAGLGAFGKNELVHNSKYGTLLRFGAVVTSAELPADPVVDIDPCPDECTACIDACPTKALSENGSILKTNCGQYAYQHTAWRNAWLHASKDEMGKKLFDLELLTNTTGYNYWISCLECFRVCPNNYQ